LVPEQRKCSVTPICSYQKITSRDHHKITVLGAETLAETNPLLVPLWFPRVTVQKRKSPLLSFVDAISKSQAMELAQDEGDFAEVSGAAEAA
jgi:hypothetical protein